MKLPVILGSAPYAHLQGDNIVASGSGFVTMYIQKEEPSDPNENDVWIKLPD